MNIDGFDDEPAYSEWRKRLEKYGMNTNQHSIYFLMLTMSGIDGEISKIEMETIFEEVHREQRQTLVSGNEHDSYGVFEEARAYYIHLLNLNNRTIYNEDIRRAVYGLYPLLFGEFQALKKKSLRKWVYDRIREVATSDGVIKDPELSFLDFIEEVWEIQNHKTEDKIDSEEEGI